MRRFEKKVADENVAKYGKKVGGRFEVASQCEFLHFCVTPEENLESQMMATRYFHSLPITKTSVTEFPYKSMQTSIASPASFLLLLKRFLTTLTSFHP